ncbi:DUF2809 domain-containing protein [bacterium]|nr:DUF2809 domain-containing protein [bacterium]
MTHHTYRRIVLIALVATVPIGFACKYYQGWLDWWWNDYGAAIFYEIFWILLAVWLLPRTKPGAIALWVFAITCVLEILQLWHPAWLQAVRATLVGRLLLGTTFSWWDFPHYAIGCALPWWGLRSLRHHPDTQQSL